MKILVVDDEPTILELVTQFLNSSAHHEARPASSAKAALEAMADAEEAFDCFLVDIQMPELDGISFVSLVRQTPGYRHTPIIMLTAMQDKHYLDKAFAAGATDYATKPIDFVDLHRRIRAVQTLSIDKVKRQAQPFPAGVFGDVAGAPEDVSKTDTLPLPGIETAIDYGEFENYVVELQRRRAVRAKTLAVKLGNLDRVYDECSSEEFQSLVQGAARAIQDTLLSEGGVLSYRGSGVFLCVLEGRQKTRRNALQNALNSRFFVLHGQNGLDLPPLLVGDQVSLGNGATLKALEALATAVESAENRNTALSDIFDVPKRLFLRPSLSDEQRHLERRAFESLLQEALAEPKDDAWNRKLMGRVGTPG